MKLEFSEEETKIIETIAKYYDIVKELLIYGEQVDPENRTLTQPINECRNCLDHLTRIILHKLGQRRNEEPDGYVKTNLEKAYGHIYRAAYDTLDWVSLNLKELTVNELKGFSVETINNCIPSYYSVIKPRFETIINREIANLRIEKDVAVVNETNIIKYGQITSELKDLYQKILDAEPGMVECEMKTKKQRWIGYIVSFIVGGGLIGLIFGLIQYFASRQTPINP